MPPDHPRTSRRMSLLSCSTCYGVWIGKYLCEISLPMTWVGGMGVGLVQMLKSCRTLPSGTGKIVVAPVRTTRNSVSEPRTRAGTTAEAMIKAGGSTKPETISRPSRSVHYHRFRLFTLTASSPSRFARSLAAAGEVISSIMRLAFLLLTMSTSLTAQSYELVQTPTHSNFSIPDSCLFPHEQIYRRLRHVKHNFRPCASATEDSSTCHIQLECNSI